VFSDPVSTTKSCAAASLTFAPIDFERQSLADGLAVAGLRRDQPAYFQWLGVTPYLTREAIISTLDFVASINGAEVVLTRWNSTEVYAQFEGKWKIIHSHWSYIKPELKTPLGPA